MTDHRHTTMKDLVPGKLYKLSYHKLHWINFFYTSPKKLVQNTNHSSTVKVTDRLYFNDSTIPSAKSFMFIKSKSDSSIPGDRSNHYNFYFLYGKDEVMIGGFLHEELFVELE